MVALSQASPKQVYPSNWPFTHATLLMKGSMLLFTRALMWALENPVVAHDVVLPWPQ